MTDSASPPHRAGQPAAARDGDAAPAPPRTSAWKGASTGSLEEHLSWVSSFYGELAGSVLDWRERNAGYHDILGQLARFYVPPGSSVLEVGSGTGDLLAGVSAERAVGVDLCPEMVELAGQRHPDLDFRVMPAERLDLGGETFDYVILSDLVGDLHDIQRVFERLRSVCHPRTRIVINWYSRVWESILRAAERLGLKAPQPMINWTTPTDVTNLLELSGFEVVSSRRHVLLPKRVPLLHRLANRYLAYLPLLRWFCLTNWVVARPAGSAPASEPTVSVVCPCRNEAGNIDEIVARLPRMGAHTELIFVEGGSRDDTLARCRAVARESELDIRVFVQPGSGKADAVWLGFERSRGDVLMILDADLSVMPENLPRFYEALVSGRAEFVNGSRLVYGMDPSAMRFLNLIGNKFFAAVLSRILGQPVRDTLCGTKVLTRDDYQRLRRLRPYFATRDPFGDFDLLFGAARLSLRIREVPVRYRERRYGETNISRFSDGLLLLRMAVRGARKLLFIP